MLSIEKTVQSPTPRVPFPRIAEHILGKSYELSLVFIGDALMRRLNTQYRRKDRTTNVLAFPLMENSGEIFINTKRAAKEARDLGVTTNERIAFLFIHACLHLKGHIHGAKMEKEETRLMKRFRL